MTRSKLGVLTAGVSLLALGVAAPPVFAQETETEGVRQTDPVNVYTVPAGDNREFGEEDLGTPGLPATDSADATVTCAESTQCTNYGAIEQEASGATFLFNDINIAGTQIVRASAIASATGFALAAALIDTGIEQSATGGSTGINRIDIFPTGTLQVRVNADAVATSGTAIAYGLIPNAGVEQLAYGLSSAAANIVNNDGDFDIGVDVTATGAYGAFAIGYMNYGLFQAASAVGTAGTAFNSVNNTGTMDIGVTAVANAAYGPAVAVALMSTGLQQVAYGVDAGNTLFNSGALTIDAVAQASGSDSFVFAVGALGTGVGQVAYGVTEATNFIFNGSPLVVAADADAVNGTGAAFAYAGVGGDLFGVADYGILQRAVGDLASNAIENRGEMTVSANAFASAPEVAYGFAQVGYGIVQDASAIAGSTATAANNIDNSGSLAVAADASAVAVSGQATAYGQILAYGIHQDLFAFAGSAANGTNSIVNSGDISVIVDADASGFTSAVANAINSGDGIDQYGIVGVGTGTAVSRAVIDNDGSIDILVTADADATGINVAGPATQTAGSAFADAQMDFGINQLALAFTEGGGTAIASALIANEDATSIDIAAIASANGVAFASADATIIDAIDQDASALAAFNGDAATALASLTNPGAIDIDVRAVANAAGILTTAAATPALVTTITGVASASASLDDGVDQGAFAVAVNSVISTGATPTVQYGGTANADAVLNNSGSLAIDVAATASAADAYGYGAIETGVEQDVLAIGGDLANATALIDNSGSLGVALRVNATGLTNATASAEMDVGIAQSATAVVALGGTANANATFLNSGSLDILAAARAEATDFVTFTVTTLGVIVTQTQTLGDAFASAFMSDGVYQGAFAIVSPTGDETGGEAN
ncbi:MAG: beta strand repeat-containing protein, partial [Sphingomonadaceae bacterium]